MENGKKNIKSVLQQVVQVSIWRKKKYVIWACAIPVALFGYEYNSLSNKNLQALTISLYVNVYFIASSEIFNSIFFLIQCRYFVPYVHLAKYVENVFNGNSVTLPIMCCGITSGIGRLVFGYIADFPKVNRIFLQQVQFFLTIRKLIM